MLDTEGAGDYRNNFYVDPTGFVDAARYDFRLVPASPLTGKGIAQGAANGVDLTPRREYVHPRRTRAIGGGAQQPNPGYRLGQAN